MLSPPRPRAVRFLLVALSLSLGPAACGVSRADDTAAGDTAAGDTAAGDHRKPVTVRLGYFPNITHATAIAGVERGIFAAALVPDRLAPQTFTAGPQAVEALFSGGLDAAYLGPNPTINAWQKSGGAAVRVISGATAGGAALVVQRGISDAARLAGKRLASPQLGGTQDVALRSWLADHGLTTHLDGGGDVAIVAQENSLTLPAFRAGTIAGAWVPEPWATRLVHEGHGVVLVDERKLWPDGMFVTAHLVVRTAFLRAHPGTVRRLLEGQVEANRFVHDHPAEAHQLVNRGITRITGKNLSPAVIEAAWRNLTFTNDPIAASLAPAAQHAARVGLLAPVSLRGIYDLGILNDVLARRGEPRVKDAS